MKKSIPMPVIAGAVVVALVAVVVFFVQATGDPEPTAKNVPDYTKMSKEEVARAYQDSKKAEQDALAKRPQ